MAEVLTPIIGYGGEFAISTDGGSTYTSVGQVEDLTPPGAKTKDVDVSYIQMSQPWRLFKAGLADGGTCKFKIIFKHTDYYTLFGQIRVDNYFKATFSDLGTTASTLVFQGFLAGISNEFPMDDKVMADFEIKVSGKPTFTKGT